jgi:hypothetical protein
LPTTQYDASGYTYVWKTDKTWAGTCRELTLHFRDGTVAKARSRSRSSRNSSVTSAAAAFEREAIAQRLSHRQPERSNAHQTARTQDDVELGNEASMTVKW